MGKKLPHTPQSQIKGVLRGLFLRSREHSAVLKRTNSTCECCGKKKSMAKGREVKVEIHHNNSLAWPTLVEHIRKHLLCDPKDMTCLCAECHKQVHATGEL